MNLYLKPFVWVILSITVLNAYAQETRSDSFDKVKIIHKIDNYLNSSVANGFSGAVLVARKGEILLSKGYGWANRSSHIPNTSSTVFNIGSVTKQFTASAVMKLVEQGKLKTSDDLSRFFDDIPQDKKEITVHQLLTHTSGISSKTGGFRYDEASKEDFLREFFESELRSNPGTIHEYANANYILLAVIIESVSGQDYSSFLHQYLFEPSDMNHTGYRSISFDPEQMAHGYYYHITDEEWKDWGITQDYLPESNKYWYSIGKGDIYSTVEDLYKWHLALEKNMVLSPKMREIQETPYVPESDDMSSYYGYGWAISTKKNGAKLVAHNGSNGVYFADFVRYIDDEVVVIYLTNSFLGSDSEYVAREIGKMIFDPSYQAETLSMNIYEAIHQFMKNNSSVHAKELPHFLKKDHNYELKDPSILNRIAYRRLQKEEKPDWSMALFKLNVDLFPEDGNLWDSLGEAYLKSGLKEEAIKCYSKAVELGHDGSVKALNELLKS